MVHSKEKPPRTQRFKEFVNSSPEISAFTKASPKDMGEGAGGIIKRIHQTQEIPTSINGRTSKHWKVVLLCATEKLHLGWVSEVFTLVFTLVTIAW